MFAFLDPAMRIFHFHNTASDFIWELKQFPCKSLLGNTRRKPPYLPHVPQCLSFLSLLTYSGLFIFVNLGMADLQCSHHSNGCSGKTACFQLQPQNK